MKEQKTLMQFLFLFVYSFKLTKGICEQNIYRYIYFFYEISFNTDLSYFLSY